MANLKRHFIAGRMNKSVDERLVPNGEYIDAMNVRLGSSEASEVGSVENSKGNTRLTTLKYNETELSPSAKCIGAYEDGSRETVYWFVHDPAFTGAGAGATGKLDMIVSLETKTNSLFYHIISVKNGSTSDTTLNFNPTYLITGVDMAGTDLLVFTDNINPPRSISISRNYENPFGSPLVDQFTAESLLVVKKPPINSPGIVPLTNASQNDFLEDRFISFAYRYRYADGEFSATSQFSAPSFIPKPFEFSIETYLNVGMENLTNACEITYNSGSELVKSIELLFKDMNSGTIKVIEKLNKLEDGLADDTEYTYTFSNSKVFTILPSSEILRLYDNVPLLAQAQTMMGNRLVYGNYYEGYDLIDSSGQPLRLNFTTSQLNIDIGEAQLTDVTSVGAYTIDGAVNITDGVVAFDFAGLELKAGSAISLFIRLTHSEFSGGADLTETNTDLNINFTYILPQAFATVYELASSGDFLNKIGTASNIEPVPTSCNGVTLTDNFNCLFLETLDTYTKTESGITAAGQPISIIASVPSTEIKFQFPAMKYVDGGSFRYEYIEISLADGEFLEVGNPSSLHSDRGYEIGIVYMDDFNRASTALVSKLNTEHVACSNSDTQNKIEVTIPTTQVAPFWASRYKFVIKPDKETYDTIYTDVFFDDSLAGASWFLLEGENARKVVEGDILRVKADVNGAMSTCTTVTVLEKGPKAKDFIEPKPVDSAGVEILVPAGAYMKIRANSFDTQLGDLPFINIPNQCATERTDGDYPKLQLFMKGIYSAGPPAEYTDYTIPAGSRISIKINWDRNGKSNCSNGCEERRYDLSLSLTSSQLYTDFKDWWDGDGVAAVLNSGEGFADCGEPFPTNQYIPTFLQTSKGQTANDIPTAGNINYLQFLRYDGGVLTSGFTTAASATQLIDAGANFIGDGVQVGDSVRETTDATGPIATVLNVVSATTLDVDIDLFGGSTGNYTIYSSSAPAGPLNNNALWLVISGAKSCGNSDNKESKVCAQISILRSENLIVFETEPVDATPDLWYESSVSYGIDASGNHLGNVTNQNILGGISGVVTTAFFNCYSFGNGIESYKIRDSIVGKPLALGNRVTSTSAQQFKRAHRYADLTYSGVFNDETNINKINEFNLGLLNFKPLEDSFGPIYLLDGRETDILTLQEDKISYVLAGKNLLSDSTGGGSVASVPQVLGTQIARVEKYGISANPESFVKWGYYKFFTDSKRGALIQLKGQGQAEQLTVLSEMGMRSWFRDLFIGSQNTQKLGAFDPYMNEFVLSSNDVSLPTEEIVSNCGVTRTVIVTEQEPLVFAVDFGESVGSCTISYDILSLQGSPAGPSVNIAQSYTGTSNTESALGTGALVFNKADVLPSNGNVTITAIPAVLGGKATVQLEITVGCPVGDELTLINVCITSPLNAGKFVHNQYSWVNGDYNSPLHSKQIAMKSLGTSPGPFVIADYSPITSYQGGGIIPANGATVSVIMNRILPDDDFQFRSTYRLMYLRSSTLYADTEAQIAQLLVDAVPPDGGDITPLPITNPDFVEGTFTMPSGSDGDYLYIIHDYYTT